MKLNYIKYKDCLLPNLILNNSNNKINLNKYSLLKLNYLKSNKKSLYTKLLMQDKLYNHLLSIGIEAKNKVDFLINEYINNDELLTEKLKNENPLEWTKLMNNYKILAEEIVLKEIIYV